MASAAQVSCPVAHRKQFPYGGEGWVVTSYEAVKAVLTDPRFSRAATADRDIPRLWPPAPNPNSMASMDPPEHTRLRRLLSHAFTMRRVNDLQPGIQSVVEDLLDRLTSPADLVGDFSRPLVATVLGDLVGIPTEHRGDFHRWVSDFSGHSDSSFEQLAQSRAAFDNLLVELVLQRRNERTRDLLAALVHARDDGDGFSDEELFMLARLLIIAGADTTSTQLSWSVHTLLTHPEQLKALRADPGLMPAALEELLRFTPLTTGSLPRMATEDVELGGEVIAAGECVMVSFPAANHDEAVFDRPDRFDIARPRNHHLAFGHGIHHCLGSHLARLILTTALTSLLARFPGLELAEEVTFVAGYQTSGPEKVLVRW